MESLLLAFFAVARLGEGVVCLRMGLAWRRWAVSLWGAIAILLSIPIAAKSLGWDIPTATSVALSGGHAVLGMCVVAAMVSSTAEKVKVDILMARAGLESPTTNGWRP